MMENPFTEEEIKKRLEKPEKKKLYFKNHPNEAEKLMVEKAINDTEKLVRSLEEELGKANLNLNAETKYTKSDDTFSIITKSNNIDNKRDFSIMLNENVLLDFNKNFIPIAMRFLKASKYLMNTKSKIDATVFRNNPIFKLEIVVSENNIKVEMDLKFKIHNKAIKHELLPLTTSNELNIPPIIAEIS
jgi:hypothetical protein